MSDSLECATKVLRQVQQTPANFPNAKSIVAKGTAVMVGIAEPMYKPQMLQVKRRENVSLGRLQSLYDKSSARSPAKGTTILDHLEGCVISLAL